jgi:hypothetical protein
LPHPHLDAAIRRAHLRLDGLILKIRGTGKEI